MKWFHNDKVSLGWAIGVEIVVHAIFALQALLLGNFLGEIALTSVLGPAGGPVGAWGLAIAIFGSAFQAFVLGEYMREHVEAFEATAKGNGSYLTSWKWIKWIVGGIEMCSLFFRCYKIWVDTGNGIQSIVVAVLGVILMIYAVAQAKVIHASVNRPVEYDVNRARNQAGRAIVSDALDVIPHMTAEQKRRFYTGDLSAIEEVYESNLQKEQAKLQSKEDREERKQQRKREREQREEEKRERARQRKEGQQRDYDTGQSYTKKLLGDPDEEDSPPFLKAVPNPNNQAQQDGRNRA